MTPSNNKASPPLAVSAAWFCAAAPLIVAFVSRYLNSNYPSIGESSMTVVGYLGILGLSVVAGVYALLRARKVGIKRVVPPAGFGLLLTFAILGIAYRSFNRYIDKAEETRDQVAQENREIGRDAVLVDRGWFSAAAHDEHLQIVGVSLGPSSKAYEHFMGLFDRRNLSIFQVTLINRSHNTIYSAGSAITLVDVDGREVDSMSIEQVASSLVSELKGSKGFDLMFRDAHTVNPGETMPNLIAVFDTTVSWPAVKAFRIAIDGQEFEIDGRFLTAEEKAMLQQGQVGEN